MQNLQQNFEKILHKLREIFKNSFCSAHIVDSDALPITNYANEEFEYDIDQICTKACALSSELETFNIEGLKQEFDTHVVKNKDFLYIFSRIHETLKLIMVLKNNDNDFTLNNVERISNQIGDIVKSMIFDDNILDNIFSDFQSLESDKLHVLNSEDILIRKILFELKSIFTPVTYKTRLMNAFNTNSINVNSNTENLHLILRLVKLLKNNFAVNLR
jgi:hypothetical protein